MLKGQLLSSLRSYQCLAFQCWCEGPALMPWKQACMVWRQTEKMTSNIRRGKEGDKKHLKLWRVRTRKIAKMGERGKLRSETALDQTGNNKNKWLGAQNISCRIICFIWKCDVWNKLQLKVFTHLTTADTPGILNQSLKLPLNLFGTGLN